MKSRFMRRTTLGAVVGAALLATGAAQAVGVPGQGTWETTLLPRDLDGNAVNGPEAFYDTALNITWLRNADMNGPMDWQRANTWANTLVVGGIGGWRLPTMVDTGAPGCDWSYAGGTDCGYNVDTATSEMAHLYYVTLSNLAFCPPGDATCAGGPQAGWGLTNTGGFQNFPSNSYSYWSGLEYAPSWYDAWFFYPDYGIQGHADWHFAGYALAVRPGDVAAVVPEPQTYALMLMGIGALMLALRRRPH
jgi:PEP-CTERM motif